MINYMDRIVPSIAAKSITEELHLSLIGMGYLFSSFIRSYALLLIPVGLLINKFGVKRVGELGIFIWSLMTALGPESFRILIHTRDCLTQAGIFAKRISYSTGIKPNVTSVPNASPPPP